MSKIIKTGYSIVNMESIDSVYTDVFQTIKIGFNFSPTLYTIYANLKNGKTVILAPSVFQDEAAKIINDIANQMTNVQFDTNI